MILIEGAGHGVGAPLNASITTRPSMSAPRSLANAATTSRGTPNPRRHRASEHEAAITPVVKGDPVCNVCVLFILILWARCTEKGQNGHFGHSGPLMWVSQSQLDG